MVAQSTAQLRAGDAVGEASEAGCGGSAGPYAGVRAGLAVASSRTNELNETQYTGETCRKSLRREEYLRERVAGGAAECAGVIVCGEGILPT